MAAPRRLIAKEGWPFILAATAVALVVKFVAGVVWSVPFWLLALAMAYVFRTGPRQIPPSPLGIVSPVDGRVTAVAPATDPYLHRPATQVSIEIASLGEYTTRAPTEAKINRQWIAQTGDPRGDSESPAMVTDKAEQPLYAMWLQTDEGDDVLMELVETRHFRPSCYVNVGERVGQGQCCGVFPFGGELRLLLPANARVQVAPGQIVRGGTDLVGTLVHDGVAKAVS